MLRFENSLGVSTQAAAWTVRCTVQRNCRERNLREVLRMFQES